MIVILSMSLDKIVAGVTGYIYDLRKILEALKLTLESPNYQTFVDSMIGAIQIMYFLYSCMYMYKSAGALAHQDSPR